MSHFFLSYPVAEECREHDGCTYDKQASTDHHHYLPCDAFLPRIHLDIDLQTGIDGDDGGNGVQQVEDIHHVLYFACNCTDNQSYVKFGKGKCSQNDTRIVLPMNVEKECVQLPQNRVKLPIEAHYSTKHILTV